MPYNFSSFIISNRCRCLVFEKKKTSVRPLRPHALSDRQGNGRPQTRLDVPCPAPPRGYPKLLDRVEKHGGCPKIIRKKIKAHARKSWWKPHQLSMSMCEKTIRKRNGHARKGYLNYLCKHMYWLARKKKVCASKFEFNDQRWVYKRT